MLVLAFLLAGCAMGQGISPAVELQAKGWRFVQLLGSGNYSEAYDQLDSSMKAVMSEAKLREEWAALVVQLGPYVTVICTSLQETPPHYSVFVTTQLQRAVIDVRVVYTNDAEVVGLWFIPRD